MAEAIGIIASGINIAQLAAQISTSVARLKSYWDQVKDAPEDILFLIEELDSLSHIIADIEDHQRNTPLSKWILDDTSLSRSHERCKKGADRLREVAGELHSEIGTSNTKLKRKYTSAKVVLKKDSSKTPSEIGQCWQAVDISAAKLYDVRHVLSFHFPILLETIGESLTTFRAMMRLQPDIIHAKLSQKLIITEILPIESPVPDSSSSGCLSQASTPSNVAKHIAKRRLRSSHTWCLPPTLLGSMFYEKKTYSDVKKQDPNYTDTSEDLEELTIRYNAPKWLVNWC